VRAALTDDTGSTQVPAAIAHAEAIGVRAVPTFVFNGTYAIQGAQEQATFLRALERITAQTRPVVVDDGATTCADGSCVV
jgi:predicted DsbA family dithiol-disulfide isomerase